MADVGIVWEQLARFSYRRVVTDAERRRQFMRDWADCLRTVDGLPFAQRYEARRAVMFPRASATPDRKRQANVGFARMDGLPT